MVGSRLATTKREQTAGSANTGTPYMEVLEIDTKQSSTQLATFFFSIKTQLATYLVNSSCFEPQISLSCGD
jgi:hypothetical protein